MTMSNYKAENAACPYCRTVINFQRPLRLGQTVICPDCYAELNVQQLKPLEFSWTFYDCAREYVGIDD